MPPKSPCEIVIAHEISESFWHLYQKSVDLAPEIKDELANAAIRAEKIYFCLYDLWQFLGGTSDIRSVFERFTEWQSEMEALQSRASKILEEKERENDQRYY
jgi:hypothetical protein